MSVDVEVMWIVVWKESLLHEADLANRNYDRS